ncbi:hypothetical protein [Microbispora sp. KK1-11]|uniref:hypothetical protein n=1 Tax=Microbispora sp. KK1-11 TaxID=2053005 RepID=UPI001159E0BC|nr:hypothetical protein [Microbispora sp. KK1-11]TQS29333.1 hypothetical protein FLW16_10015 [Microbispora sp. KK1-11]
MTKFERFAGTMAEAKDILTDLSGTRPSFPLGVNVCDQNDRFGLFLQVAQEQPSTSVRMCRCPSRDWVMVDEREQAIRTGAPRKGRSHVLSVGEPSSIGCWTANGGANQQWQLVPA